LPSILLNSHVDVVPAEKDKWENEPFAAVEVCVLPLYP
jgi:aminoacylase